MVGAGHAHLLLLSKLARIRAAGLEPLLVAPAVTHYSGLATGVLSGALPRDANRIDVAGLAARCRVSFIDGMVSRIDRPGRELVLADGRRVGYDLLSLSTGSGVEHSIAGDPIWAVKPLADLTRLRAEMEARYGEGDAPAIVVAGAGSSGTEVAASLAGLAERHGKTPAITLLGPPPAGAGWAALGRSLERRGLVRLPDRTVIERTADGARLDDGSVIRCDQLVAATGLVATLSIRIAETLQSLADPAIFASGDCAEFAPCPLPKHGVFAVRQAPVLAHNLAALARGEPLIPYRPQRRFLSILDLGNGEGFATWGGLANRSRTALRLKRRLDLAFMRRFGRNL